ncbi:unnamed protein product [Vitrella brassicaformis CCMP3155]|uniref:CCT-beta n=1 Tax=Vitrella brassicaformis (strain CCMP3155) TaxID=1169540 RepID=A0A0G4F4Z3_VITBC|nr:unnamed protein product [Vitrella brassicaformis CCMP3155]|mmetsp:Transcript_19467/g.47080  ORF Transcript_19467/g.47080 Transcript_19467/m.47080 type:complete len:536 (-) Transcript_19467:413-2020(-)|eukprot:CEM06890.1 unnamed protein product [Vitrella brassicaformis CCMP3155]
MADREGMMPQILSEEASEDKGDTARMQTFVGALAIGDLIKTTLGPKGMDKILTPLPGEGSHLSKTTITNDGATILKFIYVDNPAAKILVDISKTQDTMCGDGTTSVVVLAAELLREAEHLVSQRIHPQVICQGFREALEIARKTLDTIAFDHSSDTDAFREDLLKIAKTTLSSKLLTHEKEHFAKLAVDAVLRLKGSGNLDLIQVLKKPGGTLHDSFLEEGFILEKRIGVGQPKRMEDCKIMVANTPMDTDKIKIYGARVKVESFEAVQAVEAAEKDKMKRKVDKILAHGCNVFINRQLIYNYPDQLFKQAGVMAIEHSDFDGMERLAAVLGADIVSTFDNPDKTKLGHCKTIHEMMIGEDKVIQFSGCEKGESCTIVLRGASTHVLDEAERSLHDALAVLSQTVKETRVVWGGGSAEMAMANAVDELARTVEGKKSLAIEAFAKALRQIPTIILDNGGYDSAEIVGQLRALHTRGQTTKGIDIRNGTVGDMKDLGVLESHKSKLSQICAAAEGAEMIVRVDDVIRCAPRRREGV